MMFQDEGEDQEGSSAQPINESGEDSLQNKEDIPNVGNNGDTPQVKFEDFTKN